MSNPIVTTLSMMALPPAQLAIITAGGEESRPRHQKQTVCSGACGRTKRTCYPLRSAPQTGSRGARRPELYELRNDERPHGLHGSVRLDQNPEAVDLAGADVAQGHALVAPAH